MLFEKRGLVAKIEQDSCIILTRKGTYERIPVPAAGIQIGAEVTYPNFILSSTVKPLLLAASFLVLFFSYTLLHQATLPKAIAYVSLDINPSLEMSVDKNLSVIDVKYFNADAANLLKQEHLQGKNLYDALTVVIDKAVKANYIMTNQDNLIISTVASSDAAANPVDQKAIQRVLEKSIKTDGFTGDVKTYSVTDDFRTTAEKSGLSPGKFLIYEQLVKSGKKVNVDEVRQNKISKLVATYKMDLIPSNKQLRMQKLKSDQAPEVVVDDNGNDVPISNFINDNNNNKSNDNNNNKSNDNNNNKSNDNNNNKSNDNKGRPAAENKGHYTPTKRSDNKQNGRTGGQGKNVRGASEGKKKLPKNSDSETPNNLNRGTD